MKVSSIGPFIAGELHTEGVEQKKAKKEIQKNIHETVQSSQSSGDSKEEFKSPAVRYVDFQKEKEQRKKKQKKRITNRKEAKKAKAFNAYNKVLYSSSRQNYRGSVIDRSV